MVQFDNLAYTPNQPKLKDTAVAVVMSKEDLDQQESIRAWYGGEANLWVVQVGKMLKQFSDEAMPQYVEKYAFSESFIKPPEAPHQYIVEVSAPFYQFAGAQARITLNFQVYNTDHKLIFVKSYNAESPRHGTEMWMTGSFTMGSIIQESTATAFGIAFNQFISDLRKYSKPK